MAVLRAGLGSPLAVDAANDPVAVNGTAVAPHELDLEEILRRFVITLALLAAPALAQAQTITVRDIIELSRAGLSEQALVALVEVNPTVFPVDVTTLKTLKDAGVAPAVITAMIRSGRMPLAAPAPAVPIDPPAAPSPNPPAPQVVVIDHRDEPAVREVPVAVPVYVTVPVRRARHIDDGLVRPPHVKAVEPVFWGWGGKLRPDAWKPSAIEPQKDAKVPLEAQRK